MAANTYDYIIVGAGSAGCVLANRLTADGRHKVLLLEAGPGGHPLSRVPISYGQLIQDPAANWCYESEPEEGMANRRIPVPRGRLLGGSSAINGLVYVRGQPRDYDTWAQLGNRGWAWDDLFPIFRKIENYEGGGDDYRAEGGLLHVSECPDESPLYDALLAAGGDLGLAPNADYNGASQEGIVKTQTTIRDGRRMSVAYCYLKPAKARANLHIVTEALATGLIFDGKRCTGVRYREGWRSGGADRTAHAAGEVILAGGSINSPQLLELSGVGQPQVLADHGIDLGHELPGVGENLRDHIAPRMQMEITQPGITYNDRMQGFGAVWQALRYLTTGRGFMSIPSGPVLAFVRSQPHLETPDLQVHFVPFTIADLKRRKLGKTPGITASIYQLLPESRGSIHIKSTDPTEQPAIRYNFLSNALDRQVLIDGVKWTRRILGAPSMDAIRGAELAPGDAVQSDDEILDWIRATAQTAYHPVATCKMGIDPMAVVDPRLKVHGLAGLRIADGSIMPTLMSGNTNAACIMIGEKASEMILEDAA